MSDNQGGAVGIGLFLLVIIGLLGLILFQFSTGTEPGNPSQATARERSQ